jgi:hypothetical protein
MQRLRIGSFRRGRVLGSFGVLFSLVLGGGGLMGACGDKDEPSTATPTSGAGGSGSGTTTGSSSSSSTGYGGGGGAAPDYACTTTMIGATRGSAIAVSADDKIIVSANRDVGTVTVARADYSGADGQPTLTKVAELDLGAGSEPWQVAIDGCGKRAYVVLRKEQQLVTIEKLDETPVVGTHFRVGSEPTGLAVSPNNTVVYVSNWVDGTVVAVDPATMTATATIDLNATLAATGLLGTVTPRAALAHPRAIAITNNGDASDADETVVVTEWFAQRTGPETAATVDTNRKGLVYKFTVGTTQATTIDLPAVADTGFPDHNGAATGCFPNQVGSVTVKDAFAYVTSVCASPKGPIGVFQKAGACATNTDCGAVGGTCNLTTLTCNPNPTDVKTTTHPALSIINLADGSAQTIPMDKRFVDIGSTRMPHMPTDIGFFNNFAYVSASGADAVFRMEIIDGALTSVGSQTNDFINLRRPSGDNLIRNPIGIATSHGQGGAFAFVANDGSRDITALAFSQQSIAGNASANDFRILQASALPAAGSPEEQRLKGRRFFNTGLGRWSLNGEAWGSCSACHVEGLSDNVTWYFARGPRQTTSLEGSFASSDPNDQRIFNWTAIFDEIADFENNTRGISGGVGAIVSTTSTPPNVSDRINIAGETPQQQGLQGSTSDVANPAGSSAHPHSVLNDWKDIEEWVKIIRSPRRPNNLSQADVDAGRALFSGAGNCVGCHSGAKWTISKRFYKPGDVSNAATSDPNPASLSNIPWDATLNGFPESLFPVSANRGTDARMRFGAPPGAEQIQCILRPVGTFNVAPPDVGVLEKRQDMTTDAQGNAANGRGYNPPALLGMQTGAPYFHAGNARTLEELFDEGLFSGHHRSAIAQVFSPTQATLRQLVAFILAIDEDEAPLPIPVKGPTGGDLCFYLP